MNRGCQVHACSRGCRRWTLLVAGVDGAEGAESLGIELASLVHHLLDLCNQRLRPALPLEDGSGSAAAFVVGVDHDDELLLAAARISAAVANADLVL